MGGCAARERRGVREVIIYKNKISPKDNDKKNLELYYLFWFDSAAKSPEFIETQDEFRDIIQFLEIFESVNECVRAFDRVTHGKIFLVTNCAQGLALLPIVHDYKLLYSIYMYPNQENIDVNEKKNEYPKIRGIYDSITMAKRYLEDEVRIHVDIDDPMVMSIPTEIIDDEYQENFSLFLKAVNADTKEVYDYKTREILIDMCKEYYAGNEKNMEFIEKFSRSYKADDVLSWYTHESCFYRLLTRAFIIHDMSTLVDMYSFIVDINHYIKKQNLGQPTSLRVFRSRFISDEEFSLLKNNINKIITMQCFLSAQTSRDESLKLIQSIEPLDTSFKRILFEIDATDYSISVDNSFQSSTSQTVLFMLGASFKIVSIIDTTIILSQCNLYLNRNYDLQNESPIVIRGILTYLQNGPTPAIQYFKRILSEKSQTNLAMQISIYGQLGYLEEKLGNMNAATMMYERSMNNGRLQFNAYLFYLEQAAQHYAYALKNWEKASTIWMQKLTLQNTLQLEEDKSQTYEHLATAALETKQYLKVAEYISAAIEHLPIDHPQLSSLQEKLELAKRNISESERSKT